MSIIGELLSSSCSDDDDKSTLSECKVKLSDIETWIKSIASEIASSISEYINKVPAIIGGCSSEVCRYLTARVEDIEAELYRINSGLEQNLLANFEPLYVNVNSMVSYLQQFGYTAVGPINYQPIELTVEGDTTTSTVQTPVVIPPSPVSPISIGPPSLTINPSPSPITSVPTTQPISSSQRDSKLLQGMLERGGGGRVAQISLTLPLWVIVPRDVDINTGGIAILSVVLPTVQNANIYGPFFTAEPAIYFVETFDKYQSDVTITNTVNNVSANPCGTIIIQVGSNPVGSGNTKVKESETETGESVGVEGCKEGVNVDVDASQEFIEWSQTEKGIKTVYDTWQGFGVSKEQLESFGSDAFDLNRKLAKVMARGVN